MKSILWTLFEMVRICASEKNGFDLAIYFTYMAIKVKKQILKKSKMYLIWLHFIDKDT